MSFSPHVPPSLYHRRFRLLWVSLIISVSGSRMQFTALLWHISTLSSEPIALGMVGLARIIPVILFSLIGGAVADVVNRRTILFITQSVQTLTAATLGLLTLSGNIQLWHLYALTALEAVTFSFDLPARQSLTPNLVPAKDLPNAFSLQSIAFTVASIAGPVLGGIVLATPGLGQAYTYLFNAVSYLAIIFALIAMGDVPQEHETGEGGGINLAAIAEGVRFIISRPIILSSMLLDFVATFFSSATALLPLFTRQILHASEFEYGWLAAAEAIGAAVAAAIISQIDDIRPQGPILLGSVGIYGLATVLFGASSGFALAMFALMLVGVGDSVSTIIRNTIRQLLTPDYLRGRMTSVNQIFFMGGPQLGELEAGLAAQFFGVPFAIISGGIGCILGVTAIAKVWPSIARYTGDEPLAAATPATD